MTRVTTTLPEFAARHVSLQMAKQEAGKPKKKVFLIIYNDEIKKLSVLFTIFFLTCK